MDALEPTTSRQLSPSDIRGLKFFKPIRALLARLHSQAPHPNRELFYDQYITMILLYYFTPAMTSLRDIQRVSDYKSVARKLGVRRASLGSLSEASHVFDPQPLIAIFSELAQRTEALNAPSRPKGVPLQLACIAADGTLLDALPKMLWAHWIGKHDKAVKIHLQYDIFRGTPVKAELTDGNGDERAVLKKDLKSDHLYIVDRGYMDYDLYQKILDAKGSFLARLRGNFDSQCVEEKTLSGEARHAGVEVDQVVWIGGEKSGYRIGTKMRLLKVHVVNSPQHGLKPRGPRVSRKVKAVRVQENEFDIWLLTDRMDIPAESLALLYNYRWQIEIFFRWMKCTLGCKHLLANSANGIEIQMYAALIASLLVVLWTGKKPTKVTLFYLNMYFEGWCSEDELMAYFEKLNTIK